MNNTPQTTEKKLPHNAPLIVRAWKRQGMKIFAITLLGLSLSVFAITKIPPAYQVHAKVLFEKDDAKHTATQKEKALSKHTIHNTLINIGALTSPTSAKTNFKTLKIGSPTAKRLSRNEKNLINKVQRDLFAQTDKNTNILHLIYKNENSAFAEKFLNALARHIVETLPVKENAHIKKLKKQQENSTQELARLSFKYGEKNPNIIALKTKIDALKIQILDTHPHRASIIESPHSPHTPNIPDKTRLLLAGTITAFIIALITALCTEGTRNTFLSGKQLEHMLDLPCFALIPQAKPSKNNPIAAHILDHPAGQTAQAVKNLHIAIKLDDPVHPTKIKRKNKVITITSSLKNEGKTTLALWLAYTAAKSGERIVLVDANLYAPEIHQILGKHNTNPLTEHLCAQSTRDEIIGQSPISGLDIITASAVPSSALELISSPKMASLIKHLRKNYDRVIIDAPACMTSADARALQKHSDLILYAVAWNKTKCKTVHNAVTQLLKIETPRIATVLTQINLKKHVQYGYGQTINDDIE